MTGVTGGLSILLVAVRCDFALRGGVRGVDPTRRESDLRSSNGVSFSEKVPL